MRRKTGGRRLAFTIEVVSGWSDWVRAAQVIARDLGDLGVDVSVRAYDFSAWFQRLQEGDFELAIACPSLGLSFDAPTPYYVYRWIIVVERRCKPVGELSPTNWHRFGDARDRRAARRIRAQPTTSPASTRSCSRSRSASSPTAPAIPLFPSPLWGEFNSRRFVGFPTGHAIPTRSCRRTREPEDLLVLTRLAPRPR